MIISRSILRDGYKCESDVKAMTGFVTHFTRSGSFSAKMLKEASASLMAYMSHITAPPHVCVCVFVSVCMYKLVLSLKADCYFVDECNCKVGGSNISKSDKVFNF